MEKLLADYSKKQGYPYSRLPSFTEEEKKLIQGESSDSIILHVWSLCLDDCVKRKLMPWINIIMSVFTPKIVSVRLDKGFKFI